MKLIVFCKKHLLIIIDKAIKCLSHVELKLKSKEDDEGCFNALSPTCDAEQIDKYITTIEWALGNKDKIKNIAISGTYGSGKSSVIQTFIKHNKNKDYKFLNISLATFKEANEKGKGDYNGGNETLRLIELSVLQQLFYHEKDEKIPDSRFKKIKSYKTRYLIYNTVGFISFLISVLFLTVPKVLAKFSLVDIPYKYYNSLQFTASLITLIALFFILFKSTRALKGMAIKKLKIKDAEIEVDNGISKSILNNHIDEILYFFEVTDYNVVFIEDLDRFDQTEVFTKLREINLLINNSKKIKGEVVFIYAIKDEMFVDKDRTKFFDFMIPIIPVINSSNSNERLLRIVEKNKYPISEDLMDNLALFIDDMRLLYNIMNEYNIYFNKLDSGLDQNKLLSMVVYKNLYPKDFNQLSQNEGLLFKIIIKKAEYIRDEIARIDKDINKLSERIKEVKLVQLRDLKELRLVYISKIVEKINASSYGLSRFRLDNGSYTIASATEDKPFEILKEGGRISYYYQGANMNHVEISFANIEKDICSNLTYKEREKLVLDKGQVDNFKRKISDLEIRKNEVRKSNLRELIGTKELKIEDISGDQNSNTEKQKDLINILLRNAYIDENYLDYISIFHEGSLTKFDNQFLINVRTQKESEFDFKLTKCKRLIEKINLFEFEKEFVLNFDLVNKLQKRSKNCKKKEKLFEQLSNQTKRTLEFIDKFIDVTTDIGLFMKVLCAYWQNVWAYVYDESVYEDDKKEKYLKLILKHAPKEYLKPIFRDHISYLNSREDFLKIIEDEKRLKEIIETLELEFVAIDDDSPESLLNSVYDGKYYDITVGTLELFLNYKNRFDERKFTSSNYSAILNSNLKILIGYVKDNISDYIENVYLQIEGNINEPLSSYLELLNTEDLDFSTIEEIILQVNTKVSNLSLVSNSEVRNLLLENSKVEALWDNVLQSYIVEEETINESLIVFLNDESNALLLSEVRIPNEGEDKNVSDKLSRSLINHDDLDIGTYDLLTKSIPSWYSDIDIENLSHNQVLILVDNMVIAPTVKSFNSLKEHFVGLNIRLLEKYSDTYSELLEELVFDKDDMLLILKSSAISSFKKNIFIEHCSDDKIITSPDILKLLSEMLLNDKNLEANKFIINAILLDEDIAMMDRVRLFVEKLTFRETASIDAFIETLDEEYSEIANRNKKATVEDTEVNKLFLDSLKSLGYISSISKTKRGLKVNHKRSW